jgi:aspartate beta-hydroxylase
MAMAPAEAQALARSAADALRAGRATEARSGLERLLAEGQSAVPFRLMLAQACRMLGDPEAEVSALDAALAAEPGNVLALVMRGDVYHARGDTRAATSFYQAALDSASRSPGPLPPQLRGPLDHAQARIAEAGRNYESWLASRLSERGLSPAEVGARFEEAFDILLGRRQIYFQQPSAFYFPGLPQVQFYERERFEWAAPLEAATPVIRAEASALLDEGASFKPYVEAEKDRPHRDFHGMNDDPSWGAFYLWRDGALVEENAVRCPRTVEALEAVPMSRIGSRTPSVLFSLLRPGAHIPPHHGMLNTRLICHLPLIVPPGCWLRVGNETRHWEEGKLLVFDDSMEHEARNPTGQLRLILLFDIWRPELDERERSAVSAMFEAIDGFSASAATQQRA